MIYMTMDVHVTEYRMHTIETKAPFTLTNLARYGFSMGLSRARFHL